MTAVWPNAVARPVRQTSPRPSSLSGSASASSSLKPDRQQRRWRAQDERRGHQCPRTSRRRPPCRYPCGKHRPANPDEQSEIERKFPGPDRRPHRRIGFEHTRSWAAACRNDREQQRAADRMPVGRDHAPAQDVRAAAEWWGRERDGFILRRRRGRNGFAIRADDPHH